MIRRLTLLLVPWLIAHSAYTFAASLTPSPADIALNEVSANRRELVRSVLEKPTLAARGPGESFHCNPDYYRYFLDHPDRAVTVWRKLGARCVSIVPKGENQFGWSDDKGSEVAWEAVYKGASQRVWFAEGKVKPGPLMAAVPVKVVVVLHHQEQKTPSGGMMVHHYSDLYVHTDSKSAAVATKLLGNSANKLAEQGLGQLQLFFSGLSWYLDRHPDQAEALLKE